MRFDCIVEGMETPMSLALDFVEPTECFTPEVTKSVYWRLCAIVAVAGLTAGTWAGLSFWLTASANISAVVFVVTYVVAVIGLALLTSR